MVEPKSDIIAELTRSADRMREIRLAAAKLRLLRTGAEPDPRLPQPLPPQPPPRFTGELERSNLSPT